MLGEPGRFLVKFYIECTGNFCPKVIIDLQIAEKHISEDIVDKNFAHFLKGTYSTKPYDIKMFTMNQSVLDCILGILKP